MKIQLLLLVLFITFTGCSTSLKFPKEETSSLKLCFVGDMGMASVAQKRVAQALKHEKCHEIYFLGDIIYPNGIEDSKDPALQKRFFKYYLDLSQRDNRPKLHIVLGNHDYIRNPDAWMQVAEEHHEVYFPARYYWVKKEDVCLVALDSNVVNYAEQAAWLKEKRSFWQDCHYVLALAHQPLFTNGPEHLDAPTELKRFYEDNVVSKFDFLITGHEHIVEYLGVRNGTTFFLSGAGGAVAKGYQPGYLTLEKMNDQATSLVMKTKTIGSDGRINIKAYAKEH